MSPAKRRRRTRARAPGPGSAARGARTARTLALALAALVGIAFAPAFEQREFCVIDDPFYVSANPDVAGGLGVAGAVWAFRLHGHMGNWHPVTWLSHMSDVSLFGFEPRAHKAVNVVLHAAATVLCFYAFLALTGELWPSALAAALFGVHPLRVESVVWISERKDVLAAFFWMAALLVWARSRGEPRGRPRWIFFACFALGLASKSMVVTLPLVLLLLDMWPLSRWPGRPLGSLVREKLPLVALSAAVGLVTIVTQSEAEGVATFQQFGLAQRVANALASLGDYLASFALPRHLGPYYPHRFPTAAALAAPGAWLAPALSLIVLTSISALAFATRRRLPAIAVGWLWFLIALAPVLGLLQVGTQGMADRYTYLPSAGLALALAFPLWGAARRTPRGRRLYAVAVGAVGVALLAPATFATARHWRTNVELCRTGLAAIEARGLPPDGFLERMLAASYLLEARRPGAAPLDSADAEEALGAAQAALRLRPDDPAAHSTWTDLLIETGRFREAVGAADAYLACARTAGRRDFVALAWYARGIAFSRLLDYEQARLAFEQALAAEPHFALAAESLAWARAAAAASRSPAQGTAR